MQITIYSSANIVINGMNVALTQVGPPIRELWINLAYSLAEHGASVTFLGPSPAFETLLYREKLRDSVEVFDKDDYVPIPDGDRRSDIIRYNRKMTGRTLSDLKRRCYNYKHYFDVADIDVAVFWNDIDVGRLAALDTDVETLYMENGYLPDTIQLDTEGVNKNASFADLSYREILDATPIWTPTRNVGTDIKPIGCLNLRSKIYALCQTRGNRGNLTWTIRQELKKQVESVRSQFAAKGDQTLPDEYVFVPLQVHDDTQVLYNSPYIDNMYEFVEIVHNAVAFLDQNISVVIKEHPVDFGRTNYSNLRKEYPDSVWLQDYPIDEVIENARAVVTINSSVGMQALEQYVPVVTVGDSFYNHNPFVEHPESVKEVPEALERTLSKELNESSVDAYLKAFKERLFANGSIGDIQPETLRQLGSAIINVKNN